MEKAKVEALFQKLFGRKEPEVEKRWRVTFEGDKVVLETPTSQRFRFSPRTARNLANALNDVARRIDGTGSWPTRTEGR